MTKLLFQRVLRKSMNQMFLVRSVLLLIIFITPGLAQQEWEHTYGGTGEEEGNSVQSTSDSGYIVVGYTASFGAGGFDVYLIKTDALGETLWTRTFGGTQGDLGFWVEQTSDGGYIVAGVSLSDVYLIKTNAYGETLWTRTYGGNRSDGGFSVQPTLDSGYIVAGSTQSFGSGESDIYLIKTNALGDTQWTRTYGGTNNEEGLSVRPTLDNGYIIAGVTRSFGAGDADYYLIKTNAFGETLWTRTYGGAQGDYCGSVQPTSDSGFILVGYTYSFGVADAEIYLVKTNASGDTLWTRLYGGAYRDFGYSVQPTLDGGYIVSGLTDNYGAGAEDFYLIKTDAYGETLWTRTYGGTSSDFAYSVQTTSDSGYIVVGLTESFGAGNSDIYLIKTSGSGSVVLKPNPFPFAHFKTDFSLSANPSLFSQSTILSCCLPPETRFALLEIHDISGRLVRIFKISNSACNANYKWDGTDTQGQKLPSGCYFGILRIGLKTALTKVLLAR